MLLFFVNFVHPDGPDSYRDRDFVWSLCPKIQATKNTNLPAGRQGKHNEHNVIENDFRVLHSNIPVF